MINMKKMKQYLLSLALIGSFGLTLVPVATTTVSAAGCQGTDCISEGVNKVDDSTGPNDLMGFVKTIINILLFIIGAVAVIMIIFGGFRYVISGGDQSHVKAAKDTILYSVVGLVVAFLAFAIVNFVVKNL